MYLHLHIDNYEIKACGNFKRGISSMIIKENGFEPGIGSNGVGDQQRTIWKLVGDFFLGEEVTILS
jgi:hypothetical protein